MNPKLRLGLAFVALAVAAGAGTVSVRATRDQLRVMEACEALEGGRFEHAIELTEGRTGAGHTGRTAGECRCRALRALGQGAACEPVLEALAHDPAWTPTSDLIDGAVDARAAEEPEPRVIEELAARLPESGADAARARVRLAQRHLRRGEPNLALTRLGEAPHGAAGEARDLWFDTKLTAHAMDDDLDATRRTREAWRAAGTDSATVRARYALALSIAGLVDPDHATTELLARSLDETTGGDAKLREGLAIRLVLSLASSGRLDEALATYDRHQPELGLEGLRRGELVRAARRQELEQAPDDARRGRVVFRLEPPQRDAVLWLSPDEDVPVDTLYERHLLDADGVLAVERFEGEAPLRWVLRRDAGVVASGTIGPQAGREREVRIETRGPARTAPGHVRSRRVGDGARRVAMLLLDCGDWRITRYLRTRGELPVLGALLRDGHRAVLTSDPPVTAAALEALVWPGRRGDASLLGLVHRMGVELAGLASVGDNPFAAVETFLPERDDLFATIGAGHRSAANLLLAHGGIRAGRHGEVSGPHGMHGRVPIGRAERDLTAAERERFPALAEGLSERDLHYVRTIAAEFDATQELAKGEHAFFAVRIEPLDILTHATFADTVRDGRDDGEGLLYSVYRYIDARIGEIDAALDEDDVLIVMSDHGIRTAMEHSHDAMFVAVGDGVPRGRAPGRPHLRGVPRAVADWLGVETDWPNTGVAQTALAAAGGRPEAPGVP